MKPVAHFDGDREQNYSNLLATLSLVLEREHAGIPGDVLTGILAALEGDAEHDFYVRQRINAIRAHRLADATRNGPAPATN